MSISSSLNTYIILTIIAIAICIVLAILRKIKTMIVAIVITLILAGKTGMLAMAKSYVENIKIEPVEEVVNEVDLEEPEGDIDIDADKILPRPRYYEDTSKKGFGLDYMDGAENFDFKETTDRISDSLDDVAHKTEKKVSEKSEELKDDMTEALKKARDESREKYSK